MSTESVEDLKDSTREGLKSGKQMEAVGSLLGLTQQAEVAQGRFPTSDLRERGSRCYLNCGSDNEEATKALQLLEYSACKMPSLAVTHPCR